ncbi:MAG TPA: D-glucuronyl C5-epimerase family protein [Terriglobales bacterium]|nr:D-glucuronyl C5-epimerase family protein [Terriglobales bacterium]
MSIASRLRYYSRIFAAYATPVQSHLTFWHEAPQVNPRLNIHQLGEYYMLFAEKADYAGEHDEAGIPLLNYRGTIGPQYNPIAIAQWGLGNYNLYRQSGDVLRSKKFLAASDWLCAHLDQNSHGVWVWNHNFDWEYRTPLKAPWYSGLAQGQGISLLVRAHRETGSAAYLHAAERAFASFMTLTEEGGVTFIDEQGNIWFEEYIVSPPTHILNGFIWAAWGVYDYFLATRSSEARDLFDKAVETLRSNLHRYDLGFWSLYEQSGTLLPMVASSFYHRLHIVQLRVMYRLTGEPLLARFAGKWERYGQSRAKSTRALCCKTAFKLCYY